MKRRHLAIAIALMAAGVPLHAQPLDDTLQCERARDLPERAIGSCTRVIDSGQFSGVNLAIAYHNRGIARTGIGEYDAAILDLDNAILINSGAASALTSRGIAWHGRGDYRRAIADYNAAIRLNPRDISAIKHRGLAHYFQGDFALAAGDFSLERKLSKPDAYSAIWSYLARTRNGDSVQSEFAQAVGLLSKDEWPAPVLSVYLEKIGPEALLVAAAHADPRKHAEQRCEAHYYLGQWQLTRGEQALATANFRSAQNQCPKYFLEYTGAWAEINRLR